MIVFQVMVAQVIAKGKIIKFPPLIKFSSTDLCFSYERLSLLHVYNIGFQIKLLINNSLETLENLYCHKLL